MNRTKLKNYAPQARRDFIQAVTDRAAYFGLTPTNTEPVKEKGDSVLIGGKAFPRKVGEQRKQLEERIRQHGFQQTMEALAYTWFNRLVAIRFMELHDYLENGEGGASYRVLSNPDKDKPTPEILEKAEHVTLESLDKQKVIDLKLDGTKEVELYRLLLIAECNALNAAMPFLFERIDDETELVLPDNLLHSDSLIRKLVNEIDEEDWQQVEIIGWLYQFYISEKKDEVIGKVVASEDIPAATQLFTPNWIVKYLVQNTLGRQWLATYPHSALRQQMRYYIEPAEQTPEVQEQLRTITPTSLNPEEITLLDPACGSGHILVEAYDLFKAIYQERGYRAKDIPRLILQKNLFGLEIDDRAAQLAAFALMMKARADDRRIFSNDTKPNVLAIRETTKDTKDTKKELEEALSSDSFSCVSCVSWLMDLFEHAKTFGSLIQVPPKLAKMLPAVEERIRFVAKQSEGFDRSSATDFLPIIEQAKMLARRYDCVVANPPYMGSKYYSPALKKFVNRQYKDAKADLYACFIQQNLAFAKTNGFVGMITIPNWMFLSSFETVRRPLFENQTTDTFIHNGRGVFGSDFGSCAFVIRNAHMSEYRGSYRRLFEKQGSVASNEELELRFHTAKTYTPSNADFAKIPGSPVAYWIEERFLNAFSVSSIEDISISDGQNITANNEQYVRLLWEVDTSSVGKGLKWKLYSKGGPFRKWFGNLVHIVDWSEEARKEYREGSSSRLIPEYLWNRRGITWSRVTSSYPSFRLLPENATFDKVGSSVFIKDEANLEFVLGLLNSPVATVILTILNPTLDVQVMNVRDIPVACGLPASEIAERVSTAIEIATTDWITLETSWGFSTLRLLQCKKPTLQQSQEAADTECLARFGRMKELEEENNRLFIDAYGLQGELSPQVPDEQITLYRPDRLEDTKRLLSYAIGCMMGRYSLDKPGLIYAHSGNVGFDPSQYKTFPADDDGIVPLLDADWGIRDDAANRIVEFIGVAWPREHLEENLKFIADSLGPSKGEHPRDTIRRYLATGFYKDHLRWYKRRPIYWLFASGKQRAFQCLVYLHRYHEGTLARMRTEYVIPLQSKIAARIEQLEGDKNKATSTSHRKKLQKEQDDLKKKQAELFAFDEKLKHAADQKIALDLDDGVKVNYGKFGDLLSEVKAVCGTKEED